MNIIRFLLYPFIELKHIFRGIISSWPETALGNSLRRLVFAQRFLRIGKNPLFLSGIQFNSPKSIEVGNDCIFGRNVIISAGECHGIFIGNDVAMADGTYLRSSNHVFDDIDKPIKYQGHQAKKILYNDRFYSVIIEDNVWIGARVIILSGTKIGKGSVISAGAVLSSIIPANSIVVGNPGRVIGNREQKAK